MRSKGLKPKSFFNGSVYFLVLLCLLFGLAFTPFRLIPFAACIVLLGVYWPFSQKIDSLILRVALAFVLVTCLHELIGALFWAIHVKFTVPIAVGLELLIILWLKWKFGRSLKTRVITGSDITSLLVAFGSAAVIIAGGLHGGGLLPQLIRQITTGYDGTSHLSLVITNYDHEGYVYGAPDAVKQEIIYPKLSSYPQGWHLSTSLWWHSISSDLNIRLNPTKVLVLFYVFVFIWFVLVVYLFNRLMLYLAKVIRGKQLNGAAFIGSVAVTVLVELMALIGVIYNNFASFLPALALPLSITFLGIALFEDKKDKSQPGVFLISGLLIAGGLSFSWLLAAPMAYIATLLGLLIYFKGNFVTFLKWIISKPITLLASLALLLLGCVQGFVQIQYGSGDLINQPGGATPIYPQVMFPMLLLVLLGLYFAKAQNVKYAFATAVSGIFLAASAVYFYQIASVGHTSYYSIKITLIAFILLLVFAGAVLVALISDWMSNNNNIFAGVIFAVSFIMFIPVASGIEFSTKHGVIGSVNYALGERFLSEASANLISEKINGGQAVDDNLIVYKKISRPEDITATHFASMLSRQPPSDCSDKIFKREFNRWDIDTKALVKCANGKNFYIVASSQTYESLKKNFQNNPNFTVLYSN